MLTCKAKNDRPWVNVVSNEALRQQNGLTIPIASTALSCNLVIEELNDCSHVRAAWSMVLFYCDHMLRRTACVKFIHESIKEHLIPLDAPLHTGDKSNHDKRPLSSHTSLVYLLLWAATMFEDPSTLVYESSATPCWFRAGKKLLSELTVAKFLAAMCVTRPQRVKADLGT